ncbi:MAG: AIR synthase-related protein, partial [Chthoniobacterales bacterium]
NFGNPYKPENFWQLREAVEGVAETCRAFGTPVVGGNVSLYNESPAGVVDPTPTVAMVGLIHEEAHITTQFFKTEGDVIILVGGLGDELGGSHYLKVCHGRKEGLPPRLDIEHELAVQNSVRELIRTGLVKSAHDCSEGGLAVALAECCFNSEKLLGAAVELPTAEARTDQLLFNESQSRIVISVRPAAVSEVQSLIQSRGVTSNIIGHVGGDQLRMRANGSDLSWALEELHDDWYFSIERALQAGSPVTQNARL